MCTTYLSNTQIQLHHTKPWPTSLAPNLRLHHLQNCSPCFWIPPWVISTLHWLVLENKIAAILCDYFALFYLNFSGVYFYIYIYLLLVLYFALCILWKRCFINTDIVLYCTVLYCIALYCIVLILTFVPWSLTTAKSPLYVWQSFLASPQTLTLLLTR